MRRILDILISYGSSVMLVHILISYLENMHISYFLVGCTVLCFNLIDIELYQIFYTPVLC